MIIPVNNALAHRSGLTKGRKIADESIKWTAADAREGSHFHVRKERHRDGGTGVTAAGQRAMSKHAEEISRSRHDRDEIARFVRDISATSLEKYLITCSSVSLAPLRMLVIFRRSQFSFPVEFTNRIYLPIISIS